MTHSVPMLRKSIEGSYFRLRLLIAVIGIGFPFVMFTMGLWKGCAVQTSMSAYYHTPMRDVFVGLMFMLAATLYLYKGYSQRENIALNISALGASMVALFPVGLPKAPVPNLCLRAAEQDFAPFLHAVGGFAFFLGGAFVCIFCGRETLALLPDQAAARFRRHYLMLGAMMVAAPVAAMILTVAGNIRDYYVLIVEGLGEWTFAIYWLVKTSEISKIIEAKEPTPAT